MKRILALLLVVLMLAALLVSCSTDPAAEGNGEGGTATTPVSTDPNRVPPEVKDFGGYEFKMQLITESHCSYEIQAPEALTGEGINDTLFARNSSVSELYNIKITETHEHDASDKAFDFLQNMAASGDYYADLFSCSAATMLSKLAPQGYFLNVHEVSSLRLDKEWWDQDFLDETTINAHAYTLTGDIQTNDDLHQIGISMNMDLYEETFPEKNFYNIVVKDGAWTFEEFYNTWIEFGSSDGGTTGVVDTTDRVGYFYDSRTANYLYMAAGMKVFTIEQNEPRLSLTSDKALKIKDYLQSIVDGNTNNKSVMIERMPGAYGAGNMLFAAGQALFISNNFHDSLKYQLDMEDTVVYPPMPKYDGAQDRYYSLVHMCFEPLAISANVKDPEKTGLITEALCFYSDKLESEVMDILIQERLTSEIEPREILQLALHSKVYDMEYMADIIGWTGMANPLFFNNKLDSYQSEMKTLESGAINARGTGKLQSFLKTYAKIGA